MGVKAYGHCFPALNAWRCSSAGCQAEVKSLWGKPGRSQVWRSGASSLLHQILSPSAPVSLGSHGPPCPSLQVHFAPGSPPLQVRRPGVDLPVASSGLSRAPPTAGT